MWLVEPLVKVDDLRTLEEAVSDYAARAAAKLREKIEDAFMFLFLSEQILSGRKIDNIEIQEQLG